MILKCTYFFPSGNDLFQKNVIKLIFLIGYNKEHNELVFVIHIM